MKVAECASYNAEYPEKFPWGQVDNLTACNVAGMIVAHIEQDLRRPAGDRHKVCGLRQALRIIANYTDA